MAKTPAQPSAQLMAQLMPGGIGQPPGGQMMQQAQRLDAKRMAAKTKIKKSPGYASPAIGPATQSMLGMGGKY